ncbi:hypothetical protein [Caballeronia grimmiae]|uniref:hypothetical protein n=1 Tax=Caballeronia grimmiae TaxID=1071679 RepID=UPI0038B82EF7
MRLNDRVLCVLDGEEHVSGAGLLLMTAAALHDRSISIPPEGKRWAASVIDALLSAARAGGFKQGGVLETLIANDRTSDRVTDLAIQAIDCIGGAEALVAALTRGGFFGEDR